MKKVVCVIVSIVFLGIASVVSNFDVNAIQKQIDEQQSELHDLENELEVKRNSAAQSEKKFVESMTGLDIDRVEKDDEIAKDFVSKVVTWSDGASYDAIREEIMKTYGLAADSDFMTVFLPENIKVTQPDGSVLNYIDSQNALVEAGLSNQAYNAQYESMESYVTDIRSGTYSYFTFVTWSSSNPAGADAMTTNIMTYDIDSDGTVSNIHGYTTNTLQ